MSPEALARHIVATLRQSGHQAWLVGGCVRDLLLGAAPKDFDVSTDAPPHRLLELFPGAGCVGAHFGVALVRREGASVEVATFRSDRDYADGRRPTAVRFETDPRQDVLRRDFTINGLMLDPESGEVLTGWNWNAICPTRDFAPNWYPRPQVEFGSNILA